MSSSGFSHRLAAILAADAAGCSRLMQQRALDELACETLQSNAEHGPLGVRRAMAALQQEIWRRGWA